MSCCLAAHVALSPAYGEVLPAMGYAVLAIDHWCLGERNRNSERAMAKRLLWEGKRCGAIAYDSLTALDWALAQPGWPICPSPRSGSRWAARWLSGAPRSMNASRSASICAASAEYGAARQR